MFRLSRHSRAFALGLLFAWLPFSAAFAHCFVGPRFFPATLVIDDPCVADELSLPTVSGRKAVTFRPVGMGHLRRTVQAHYRRFRISDRREWSQIRQPGAPTLAGFADLETTFQYQLLKDASHETAMLLGLIVDWGNTGATNAGIGTPYSFLTPTYYVGQGLASFPMTLVGRGRSRSPVRSVIKSQLCPMTWRRAFIFRKWWSMGHRSNTACPI